MYICYYTTGSHDDFWRTNVFVTESFEKAQNWSNKFNEKLQKWKKYYSQYEDNKYHFAYISDIFVDKYFDRWHVLNNTNMAGFEEIEKR